MKHKVMLMGVLGVLMLASACQKSASKEEEIRVPVEVQEITYGTVVQTLSFNGDIKADFDVKVYSKVPDRIEAFYVDEGDVVAKGTPMAKILSTTIEQGYLQAEAGLVAAKAQKANVQVEYERAKRLIKENAMSQQQYDAVETQYEAASAQLTQAEAMCVNAKTQLDDATIQSPIRGIVGKRYYDVGDMASPSVPVFSVVQMDRVKITFDATEEDMGKLEVGQKAVVHVRSYPGKEFQGSVSQISPILDPVTRMATVEVLVPNKDHELKPGMFAKADITTGVLEHVLVVPRYAAIESTSLIKVDNQDQVVKNFFVYVVNDSGRAEQKKLTIDYLNHQVIAVKDGLQAGQKLVVSGQNNCRDSVLVMIADKEN